MEYQQQPQQQYYQQPQQPSYGYDQSYQQQQQPVYSQYPEQQRNDAQQQYQQYPQQQQQQYQQYPPQQGGYGAPQQGGYPNVQPGYVPNPAFQQQPTTGHGTTPVKPLIYGPNYILELKALNLDRKDASGKSDPFIQVYCAKAAAAGEGGKHKEKKEKEKHQVGGLLGMVVAGVGEAIGVEVPDSLMEKVEGVEVSGGSGGSKHPSKTGKWEVLYKSEVVRQNLNPHWQPFAINLGRLCNNDVNTKFLIECYDWDADGTHDFIGFCSTSIHELQTMKEAKFINPSRTGLSNTSGLLEVVNCKIADTPVEPFKALPSTTTTPSSTTTTSTSGSSESAHVPSTNQTPASPDINSPATSHGCCACMPHSHHHK